jgi:hypothetical protein
MYLRNMADILFLQMAVICHDGESFTLPSVGISLGVVSEIVEEFPSDF